MKTKLTKAKALTLIMALVLLTLAACSNSTSPSSSAMSSPQSETTPPPSSNSISSSTPLSGHSSSGASSSEASLSSSSQSEVSQGQSQSSGDDLQDEVTVAIGNPTPDDFKGEDFFIYQDIVCINAANIDWVNELNLTEEELLGEIKRTGIMDNQIEWDATVLPIGTKIYRTERNDILITVKGDTKIPYMKMIEG